MEDRHDKAEQHSTGIFPDTTGAAACCCFRSNLAIVRQQAQPVLAARALPLRDQSLWPAYLTNSRRFLDSYEIALVSWQILDSHGDSRHVYLLGWGRDGRMMSGGWGGIDTRRRDEASAFMFSTHCNSFTQAQSVNVGDYGA